VDEAPESDQPQSGPDRPEDLRPKLARLLEDHWVKLLVAALVALIGASALVTINGQDDSDCSVQSGNNNSIKCDDGPTPEPSADVKPGPQPNTWVLQLRNWEANSTLALELKDPGGEVLKLGGLAIRRVDATGAADTRNGRFFWTYQEGEPKGTYVLTVEGENVDGEPETKDAPFEVPTTS
jgi:hypothetical protein